MIEIVPMVVEEVKLQVFLTEWKNSEDIFFCHFTALKNLTFLH